MDATTLALSRYQHDALSALREQMRAQINPADVEALARIGRQSLEGTEVWQQIIRDQDEYSRSIRDVLNGLNEAGSAFMESERQIASALSGQARDFQAALDHLAEPIDRFSKQIAGEINAAAELMQEEVDRWEAISRAASQEVSALFQAPAWAKDLDRLASSWNLSRLTEDIGQVDLGRSREVLIEAACSATAYLKSAGKDAFKPGKDSTVEVRGETVDLQKLRWALSEVGQQASAPLDAEAVRLVVEDVIQKAHHRPAYLIVLRWLLHVIIALILGVSGNLLTPHVDRSLSPRQIQREISKAARELDIDPSALKRLRIVLRDELPAFQARSRTSRRVGILRVGEVVLVLDRKRNWTQVELPTADASAPRAGWVLSRCLGRITPERGSRKLGLSSRSASHRQAKKNFPPGAGLDLVDHWRAVGVIGSRPEIESAPAYARELRHRAERRNRP